MNSKHCLSAALGFVTLFAFAHAGCGGDDSTTAPTPDASTGDDSATGDDAAPASVCGNSMVERGEDCDDGNMVNGDGCNNDCTFSCTPGSPTGGDAKCDDKNACNGAEKCGSDHKCTAGTPLGEGASCGTNKVCNMGNCADAVCGDMIVTAPGEECDDGNTTNGDGCDSCKFSCVSTDNTRKCTPMDSCKGQGTCNDTTHICAAGTPLANGTACLPTGHVCKNGTCTSANCGDGIIEAGETCEPPNTATCDSQCQTIVAAVCGNGTREMAEQCDDGNVVNLDGCDSTCKFEQDQRANTVTMQFATDALCTHNALGGSIGGAGQSTLQTSLTNGVNSGATTFMFKFMGLSDLTGTNQASGLGLGGLGGAPVMGSGYNGASDLDWWYTSLASGYDSMRNPKSVLTATIAAKLLNASGTIDLTILLAGMTPSQLHLSSAKMRANVGATSAPTMSSGATPGHLAAEHLDPALLSFATMSNGELCGNIAASSLSTVPVPAALLPGGTGACSEGYAATNSLLDVLIGGCHALGGLITVITKTQPDQVDAAAPPAGAGGPYALSATNKVVTTCKDHTGATVTLATCLTAAAYSSFFKFTTDRVIAK